MGEERNTGEKNNLKCQILLITYELAFEWFLQNYIEF